MRQAPKQDTLDNAHYTFAPYTQSDIWGRPSNLNMSGVLAGELPVGADDSALNGFDADHQFTAPHLRNSEPLEGSDHTPLWQRGNTPKFQTQTNNTVYLAMFAAILGAALWSPLLGSP